MPFPKLISSASRTPATVFGNRLGSARTIHMDLCIRRDIPVPKVSYKPDDATINEVRVLNKLRRRYDYTHDRSIDSKYRKSDDFTSTLPDDNVLNREPVINNKTKIKIQITVVLPLKM